MWNIESSSYEEFLIFVIHLLCHNIYFELHFLDHCGFQELGGNGIIIYSID